MIKPSKVEYHQAIEGETYRSCLSSEKIQKKLGWRPAVSLAEGIKKTIEYFKKQDTKNK